MKTKIVLLVSFIAFAMTTCSNVVEDWDETLLEINFRQGDMPAYFKYKIEVDGPSSFTRNSAGAETVQVKVSVGHYNISVTAYSDKIDGTVYAVGDGEITVKTGKYSINIVLNQPGTNGVATPEANPDTGTYTGSQTITLTTKTEGAVIYYTLDGSNPNSSSTLYTGAITISALGVTTLKAIAIKVGMTDSLVLVATYVLEDWDESLLEINFGQGSMPAYLKYKIEVDGPTNLVHESVGIETIQVKVSVGHYNISVTAYSDYIGGTVYAVGDGEITVKAGRNFINIILNLPGTDGVATPEANPDTGTYTGSQTIILTTKTAGAAIYYTLDGSDPSSSSTLYTGAITISALGVTTLKAIATKAGMIDSLILTATYTIPAPGTVAQPAANLSGGTIPFGTIVTLSTTTTGADIYYTLDGSEPNSFSQLYSGSITLDTLGAVTLKAIAIKAGMTDSLILTIAYTIAPLGQVDKPTASPPAGEVAIGTPIELTTTTAGAEIWYTTDGSTPSKNGANSTKYSSPISATMTIKAIAVKAGMTDSAMLEAVYTIKIIEAVWIPAGTFTMGSDDSADYGASPPHPVTLTASFYMSKYQVTQEQYFAVMGTNPSFFSSSPATGEVQGKRPVESVSWYDAIVFCNRLSDAEGLTPAYSINGSTDPDDWGAVPTSSNAIWDAVVMVSESTGYRLPTEAQWEYACRAGTTNPYNPEWDGTTVANAPGWYTDNRGNMTHQVGLKAANDWGLYDMHGNVYEWCWDWYDSYGSGLQADPEGPVAGASRVIRGGCWFFNASALRSAYRGSLIPYYRSYYFGFRLVRP